MRGKPKSTERRVGILILLLLAVIVLAFLLTGGLFKDFVNAHPALVRVKNWVGIAETPLFVADPKNLPPPSPPRELRVAEALLPASLGAGQPSGGTIRAFAVRSEADVAAVTAAGVESAFVQAVQPHARWIYVRSYSPGKAEIIQARVADLGDAESAAKAAEARKPQGARPLNLGRGGWMADGLAGFWSGRYYTEVSGSGEQAAVIEGIARAVGSRQLVYGGTPIEQPVPAVAQRTESTTPPVATVGPARFAEVPGGRLVAPTRIDRYAENLYEKIDGKESAFRAFFVIDLKFGQYADPEANKTYDAYIYDMTSPVNAMGMYMSERVELPSLVPVGREGYISGTSVFFWKGQYYVNVLGPPDGGEPDLNNSRQIAAAIADSIADDGEPFWADKILPVESRVASSLSYQATSALGYEFLQRMFFARYEADGKKFQMYISKAADAETAKSIYDRFAESTARYDKVLAKEDLAGGRLFVSETVMPGRPSKFGVAFYKGPYFGGVYDGEDRGAALSRAKRLFETLSADDPGDPEAAVIAKPQANEESEPSEDESSGESESSSDEESSEGGESGN
jgi:hypothetical protein